MRKNIFSVLFLIGTLLFTGISFSSCLKGDDVDTNQYIGGINLNVFGPSPVARGGELRFLGSGMNQVTAISIPGCEDITDINMVSDTEIRITVPQEAQPGFVILKTSKGDITTKTELTFTEPISLDGFSSEIVKPGDELTIEGEYLNLIHQVIFAEDVVVSEENFLTHDRKTIKLVVPEEAQTGQVALSDGAEMPNVIYSEEDLTVVLPSVDEVVSLSEQKPGDELTIAGENLDLVRTVIVPGYPESVEIEPVFESGLLKFTLPDNASDGNLEVVPASGVHVTLAVLNMAVPKISTINPETGIAAGAEVVITGVNLDVVSGLSFPGMEETVQPISQSETELRLNMPVMAQSGTLVLNTKSGKTVNAGHIETLKPVNLNFQGEIKACEEATVTGENLDLVSEVVFVDNLKGEIVSQTNSQLVVSVPALAQSGNVIFNMANGEQVSIQNVNVTVPAACYIASNLEDKYTAGEIMTVEIANADLLTAVNIDNNPVQYIQKGNELMIMVPDNAGSNSILQLVSDNTSIEYTISFVSAEKPETVIWEGSFSSGSWQGNQDLGWGAYDWSAVEPGTVITVYYTLDASSTYWQLRLGGCNIGWSALPTIPDVDLPAGSTSYSAILTAEDLAVLSANNNSGLVVTGCFFTMTKITLK